ncbi:hypothetical protein BEL04_09925 [Mucilaginibacter sp. PPCGB 2223]|uniref:hypothetical protein n=1 Tax=Mucilaginibacter sp. PPCGB 2223 TaxID=1886027 RepID=UPI000827106A|nr:hypothetical protein [Mucilaginibacter sp. PPCGB 2223]OCX54544.1 hypothetical protein BEL04_09925 [Mucilaginibacter sp. PPCGB 2223]
MDQNLSIANETIRLQRPVVQKKPSTVVNRYKPIRKAIWLYFWLLLFEGALRKWFLPGLSTPLLVIRDPIALYVVLAAWNKGIIRNNIYLFGMILIGVFGMFTALTVGHGNFPVAIYGARMLLIHFPMVFVIGQVFNRDDVVKLGKIMLWLSLPMALLIGLQFYSPQSAWVNRGLGDDATGAGFAGALGYFRPPGTFSFTTGNTLFWSFAGAYVVYFLFNPKSINRLLLIGASVAVIASIPLSISRSLTFQIVLSLVFAFLAILRRPKNLGKALVGTALVSILLFALSSSSLFQTATKVLGARFTNAESAEGGLQGTFADRYLGGVIYSLSSASQQPFFGYGLGMGTKVGSQLLSGNRKVWLIAEAEWGRLVGEMGALMGLSVIAIRLGLSIKIGAASYLKMARGDMLPWMLLSFGFVLVAQGSWGQPTTLGFCTMIGGLMLSSLNNNIKPIASHTTATKQQLQNSKALH